jgi:methylase of polypeptide subunit release factors
VSDDHPDEIALARADLLHLLKSRNYRFVTPSPSTHARVVSRRALALDLRDVFGWGLPFRPDVLDHEMLEQMRAAEVLEEKDHTFRSLVRVSTLESDYFLHSAYPTLQSNAVFFGPDSYRFAAFIRRELPAIPRAHRLADIGAGSGVGGVAALRTGRVKELIATDINPAANDLLDANFDFVMQTRGKGDRFSLQNIVCSGLKGVAGRIDCIIANPPYIADPAHRAYRDGGGMHGGEVSLAWAREAAARLEPGGAFLLYTGSAIVDGEDRLKAALFETLDGFDISYREIDPDVFGEELEREDYADVERIAVVGLVAVKR